MILFNSLLLSLFVLLITFLIYLRTHNPGIVDVAWCFGIMSVGSFFITRHSLNDVSQLYQMLLLIWGGRLGIYLLVTRIFVGHKDPRYLKIFKPWSSEALAVAVNYLFQAILVWLVALTFYPLTHGHFTFNKFDLILFFLAIIAISLETLADLQLRKAKQLHPTAVCQQGLWKFSRHPNYFFEVLFWLLIAIGIFSHTFNGLSFAAPLTVFLIMHYLTIPITEQQSLETKGADFIVYQANTSRFLLWFPSTSKRKRG